MVNGIWRMHGGKGVPILGIWLLPQFSTQIPKTYYMHTCWIYISHIVKVFKKFVSRFHIFHLYFQQRVPILCNQPLPHYQPRSVKLILIKWFIYIYICISIHIKIQIFFFSQVSFNLKIILFFYFTKTF